MLIERYFKNLSQMNNPNEIQALTDNAGICEYKDLILHKNFAERWNTLYAKCSMDNQPHLKSMLEKALIINDAIATRGDLLTFFNDFPAPPRKERDDMQRYYNELNALKGKHVNAYNDAQKKFVKNCQVTAKNSMIMFYWQAHLRKGFCDAKCFELQHQNVFELLQGLNFDDNLVPSNDVSSYVFQTNLGPCKCWQRVFDKQTQTDETNLQSNVSLLSPEPNIDVDEGGVRLESESEADEPIQHESELAEVPQYAPGVKQSADVTSSSAAVPVCKRPRLVPEQQLSPKFENFAEFQEFLEVLVRECSHELCQFETTDDLKKLVDHPAMERFKGILNHEDFVLRWNELHDKCDFIPKANRRMDTDVEEVRQTLLKRPCFIKNFFKHICASILQTTQLRQIVPAKGEKAASAETL